MPFPSPATVGQLVVNAVTGVTYIYTAKAAWRIDNYGIVAAGVDLAGTITPQPLVGLKVGNAFTATLVSSNGVAPFVFTISSGSLPAGLSLNSATGAITGTPTAAGAYAFDIRATDANGDFNDEPYSGIVNAGVDLGGTITPATFAISETTAFTGTLVSSNGVAPLTWAVTLGSLPGGLTLDPSTGVVSGTPTDAGGVAWTFDVRMTDSTGDFNDETISGTILALGVDLGGAITPQPLVGLKVSNAFSDTLVSSNGVAPFVWSITSGALPTGLTLNASSGLVSGTPTVSGEVYTFDVRATDANTDFNDESYTGTVAALVDLGGNITPNPLVGVRETDAFTTTLVASNGVAPTTWSITSGALPTGLSLAAATGIISGTPTVGGEVYTFDVTGVDSTGDFNVETYTGTVTALVDLGGNITPNPLVGVRVSDTFTATLVSSNGVAPFTWSITSGALPTGLSLAAATGIISGTPTVGGEVYTFDVTGVDSTGDFNVETYTGTVTDFADLGGNITPTTVSPQNSAAFSQTFVSSNGVAPFTWAVTSGALPTGLSLAAATGVVSGTPTDADGTAIAFTLTATDSTGDFNVEAVTGTVLAAPLAYVSVTSIFPGEGSVGTTYDIGGSTLTLEFKYSGDLTGLPASNPTVGGATVTGAWTLGAGSDDVTFTPSSAWPTGALVVDATGLLSLVGGTQVADVNETITAGPAQGTAIIGTGPAGVPRTVGDEFLLFDPLPYTSGLPIAPLKADGIDIPGTWDRAANNRLRFTITSGTYPLGTVITGDVIGVTDGYGQPMTTTLLTSLA